MAPRVHATKEYILWPASSPYVGTLGPKHIPFFWGAWTLKAVQSSSFILLTANGFEAWGLEETWDCKVKLWASMCMNA